MASARVRNRVVGNEPTRRPRDRTDTPRSVPTRFVESGDAAYDRVTLSPGVELHRWRLHDLGNSSYALRVDGAPNLVVIDPWRDIDGYLPILDAAGVGSVLSLETHVHNDFISGSRELVAARHATIASAAAEPISYPRRGLKDGDDLPLGRHRLTVVASPGHTPEHVSYLLSGPDRTPIALFSGGALTVGSAGRTDLLGLRLARPLAVRLFRTIRERFAALPDATQVYPTHGGGSFCGKSSGNGRATTIGEQRASNPLFTAPTLDDFLAEILDQRPYPRYFTRMREANLRGVPVLGPDPFRVPALGLTAFEAARAAGAQTVDIRAFADYDRGHIPGSIAIDAECGAVTAWGGWLLTPDRGIVFVDDPDGRASDSVARQLLRIGFDRILGRIRGGFPSWSEAGRPVARTLRLDAPGLTSAVRSETPLVLLDVREPHEYAAGHLPGALHIPLGQLVARAAEIPRDTPVAAYCLHGYRSVTAVSLLEQLGFANPIHADAGYAGWQEEREAGR